ncbi:hypothetical protein JKP88DRAFT_251694 [Tribonema minus]|uniref:Uncharacterized protein n=1 Tax=Tribonema minus TaxID=303371 RepID=A0A835ZFQ5_9STRA|nr:hypothetical protein JKP88DRAFT_251694 [Tribonema minus]
MFLMEACLMAVSVNKMLICINTMRVLAKLDVSFKGMQLALGQQSDVYDNEEVSMEWNINLGAYKIRVTDTRLHNSHRVFLDHEEEEGSDDGSNDNSSDDGSDGSIDSDGDSDDSDVHTHSYNYFVHGQDNDEDRYEAEYDEGYERPTARDYWYEPTRFLLYGNDARAVIAFRKQYPKLSVDVRVATFVATPAILDKMLGRHETMFDGHAVWHGEKTACDC